MKKNFILFLVLLLFKTLNAQLTIYSDFNLQGTSATCLARTIYTGATIPGGLNDNIKSISLAQGFMATFAENEDGTGERYTYMANTSTLNVNISMVLQNKISFIRVIRLPAVPVRKKGSGNTNNTVTAQLNATWFYDWGPFDFSTPTTEFVPMSWGTGQASVANVNLVTNKDSITHYMSFNEPDNAGQSNIFVRNAIPLYKRKLSAGYRMVSPACTESQYQVWLDSFARVAADSGLRTDVIAVHWYDWGNWLSTSNPNPNPQDVFNRFRTYIDNVYNLHKKPIWITEFNANINRTAAVQEGFMALALPWLDADPRVERYAYFFGNDVAVYSSPGVLSPAGNIYANHASVVTHPYNVYDTRAAFPTTVLAAWNPSSFTQGGNTVANFNPTTLDPNMVVSLPLTRGSGVDLPTATVSNGYWGGMNWVNTTAASAITANRFFRFRLKSTNGKVVNYQSIDKFNIRINSTGATKIQIDFQINNGPFMRIADITDIPAVTGNYQLGPIDLSNIELLQRIPPTDSVTFRIVPYGGTNSGGTFLIGSGTGDTDPDLVIKGYYADEILISTPLPAILKDFNLSRQKEKVSLNWQTKTEINFSHFELERSVQETNNFRKIAYIKGTNLQNGSSYKYVDIPEVQATHFYRLKLVDKDGSFSYSNILRDDVQARTTSFQIYPTLLTGNQITALFDEPAKQAQLKIFNSNGQLMRSYTVRDGVLSMLIDTGNLLKGFYLMVLQQNGKTETVKFLKQ